VLSNTIYGWILSWIYTFIFVCVGFFVVFRLVRFAFADADNATLRSRIPKGALDGQVVWIVGASSGIGEHLAYKFVKENAKVILSSRRKEELERVKRNCEQRGGKYANEIMVVPLDVLDYDSHEKDAKLVIKYFGTIDILCLNSGRSQRSLIESTDLQVDREMFNLNVIGIISLAKVVLPYMLQNKKGHIVYTSSVAGKVGSPVSGTYAATKHALQGFFDTLRMEVADKNIHVTSICPGPVVSSLAQSLFTSQIGQNHVEKQDTSTRMKTERCVDLMVAAITNKIEEAWIARQPVLLFLYLSQYAPNLGRWLGKRVGRKRVHSFKNGEDLYGGGVLSFLKKKQ